MYQVVKPEPAGGKKIAVRLAVALFIACWCVLFLSFDDEIWDRLTWGRIAARAIFVFLAIFGYLWGADLGQGPQKGKARVLYALAAISLFGLLVV